MYETDKNILSKIRNFDISITTIISGFWFGFCAGLLLKRNNFYIVFLKLYLKISNDDTMTRLRDDWGSYQ